MLLVNILSPNSSEFRKIVLLQYFSKSFIYPITTIQKITILPSYQEITNKRTHPCHYFLQTDEFRYFIGMLCFIDLWIILCKFCILILNTLISHFTLRIIYFTSYTIYEPWLSLTELFLNEFAGGISEDLCPPLNPAKLSQQ